MIVSDHATFNHWIYGARDVAFLVHKYAVLQKSKVEAFDCTHTERNSQGEYSQNIVNV